MNGLLRGVVEDSRREVTAKAITLKQFNSCNYAGQEIFKCGRRWEEMGEIVRTVAAFVCAATINSASVIALVPS
jgi:hypothetical protein